MPVNVDAGKRTEADQLIDHHRKADQRQYAGCDQALVERAHDRLAGAELDEEGAGNRGQDADAANGERQDHHVRQERGRTGEEDRREHHGRDRGHRVGLEQVGRHAGAVADVVAHVVGDGRRVARIVFRNAGFDLADEVAADVGALGEDAAAETGEDRDQRGAEAERHQRVDHDAVVDGEAAALRQVDVVERHAEQREAGHQKAGDRARLEGKLKTAGERLGRRLRGADVGAHRHVHADEACRAGQHRADQEADRHQDAEEIREQREDHDADEADSGVLPPQIGLRALAHCRRNLLHARVAGIRAEDRRGRPYCVNNREHAAEHNQP